MIDTEFWHIVVNLYNTGTVPVRFVYIYWTLFIAIYVLLGYYEKIHGRIPIRTVKAKNYHYSLYVIGSFAIILHHGSIYKNWIFLVPICKNPEMFWWLGLFGFIFMGFGLYLVGYARIVLNGNWGIHIYEYQGNQQLVTDKIYSYCRHPIYSGQIIMAIGTVMLSNNWCLIFFPIFTLGINIYRARNEERDLIVRFGSEFEKYKNMTPFIVPFIR